ncbi:MAG TPA: hypothetical protein VKT33_14905 [Candidatus Angelobacter sp.]|nr:hypothetical protein [Candidatus Angelobacter sp.]
MTYRNNMSAKRYWVEETEREHKAVHILATMPFIAASAAGPAAGLDAAFCWYVLGLKKQRLGWPENGSIGVLAGPLEFDNQAEFVSRFVEERKSRYEWHPTQVALLTAAKMAENGRIKWPPSPNKLVAIEAKCLSLEVTAASRPNFKSAEASAAHTRAQVGSLLRMGFDRVALLDIIANPQLSGLDEPMAGCDFKNRLPEHSPAGHYVWSMGNEMQRGTDSAAELKAGRQNPLLHDVEVKARRAAINESLYNELQKLPVPRSLPAVFVDCEECGRLHSGLDICKPSRALALDGASAYRHSLAFADIA